MHALSLARGSKARVATPDPSQRRSGSSGSVVPSPPIAPPITPEGRRRAHTPTAARPDGRGNASADDAGVLGVRVTLDTDGGLGVYIASQDSDEDRKPAKSGSRACITAGPTTLAPAQSVPAPGNDGGTTWLGGATVALNHMWLAVGDRARAGGLMLARWPQLPTGFCFCDLRIGAVRELPGEAELAVLDSPTPADGPAPGGR